MTNIPNEVGVRQRNRFGANCKTVEKPEKYSAETKNAETAKLWLIALPELAVNIKALSNKCK
jgi:hypothetical protein